MGHMNGLTQDRTSNIEMPCNLLHNIVSHMTMSTCHWAEITNISYIVSLYISKKPYYNGETRTRI